MLKIVTRPIYTEEGHFEDIIKTEIERIEYNLDELEKNENSEVENIVCRKILKRAWDYIQEVMYLRDGIHYLDNNLYDEAEGY